MMSYSITKEGIDAKHLCTIDEKAKTVSTTEYGLVFDFRDEYGWTFKAGSGCTFITGECCTFSTEWGCVFNTRYGCTFITGDGCTFITGSDCIFKTAWGCTFDTLWSCTFKDCKEKCIVVRRDVFEVIQLPIGMTIRLNKNGIKGYKTQAELCLEEL